jgi:hypothetical protein
MHDYYVYVLFDWLGTPRYVGKGKHGSKRPREYQHERVSDPVNILKNEFIENTWIMFGEIPKTVICNHVSEREAFATERAVILALGRLDNGTGVLTNMTNGGEGTSGYKYGRERSLRANANQTPQQRSENARRANASQTPEQRRARQRRAAESQTPEQLRERARKAHASLSLEARQEAGRRLRAAQDPAKMIERLRLGRANMTPEQRSAAARKREANKKRDGYKQPPQHYRRKLSSAQVREIREHIDGWKALAKMFGVSRAAIDGVRYGRTYQEIV